MARLEILSGARAGEVCELLPDGPSLIGTSRQSVIRLRDKGVQFKHAQVLPQESGFVLVQERASAETRVNDEPLARGQGRLLRPGDRLQCGGVALRFLAGDAPAPGSAATDRPPEQAELIRLQEDNRRLADELGALVAARHHGETGRLLAELEQTREELEAAQRRRARLQERVEHLERRGEDETQARTFYKLLGINRPGASADDPIHTVEAERQVLEQRLKDLRRRLDAREVEAVTQEARRLEELGQLRRELALAREESAADRAQLEQQNAELTALQEQHELAAQALEALRAKLGAG